MRLFVVFLLLFMLSCVEINDLDRSIFIRDPVHPELPKYSEWGLNTFGAFVDGRPFVSSNTQTPAVIMSQSEKTEFRLSGRVGSGRGFQPSSDTAFSVNFILPAKQFETYGDLIRLHDSIWDLADPDVMVVLSEENQRDTVRILAGTLKFVRVQLLVVDQEPTEAILSGVFELEGTMNGSTVTVSEGRFDLGIDSGELFHL